jgi:D-3-phosphoglycerate dehydrogenase / 2-oxoglutarate reductase
MTRPTVVITDSNFGSDDVEREVLGDAFLLRKEQAVTEDDVVAVSTDAQGLLVQWAPITAEVLDHLPRVRAIVRYGIGLDNVDLAAAEQRGIVVRNVDDYCIDEVATHAVSMIGAVNRRLADYDRGVKSGDWRPDVAADPPPVEADPVGIVGLGRIGQAVATRLKALGHPVFAWDPYLGPDGFDGVQRKDALVELATAVNHLTLHAPATPETEGMVSADVLDALGPRGHLVNTSRGAAVDEPALLDALDRGTVGWASLDVFTSEPPTGIAARLAGHPRVFATPHVAYRSLVSVSRLRRSAAQAIKQELTTSLAA